MVMRGEEEEEGDVLVQLNHLMAVQLVFLCILYKQNGEYTVDVLQIGIYKKMIQ